MSFSKNEAKGTLCLLLIVLLWLVGKDFLLERTHHSDHASIDAEVLAQWVEEVNSQKVSDRPSDRPIYIQSTSKKTEAPKVLSKRTKQAAESPKIKVSDLNTATKEELVQIRGIGKTYSNRIVKYRQLLGGFHDTDQLHEVYGLDEKVIDAIAARFEIQSEVKPLNINSDSAKVLARHPYINYDLAWTLINYRKQHGDFQSDQDLQNVHSLSDSIFLKIKPYLRWRSY